MLDKDTGAAVLGEPSVEDARNKVMDALCGYGEAMFLKGNPYNKPDQRLDQKAVWQALDNYAAAIRADERRQVIDEIKKAHMHGRATDAEYLAAENMRLSP